MENQEEKKSAVLTYIFYALVGAIASLLLFFVFYWGLRQNSSIASLISNTFGQPWYFWPYVILTFGTILLFGINAGYFVYTWRKFGPPRLRSQAGSGAGSIVGLAASACPVCGSALLAAIGIPGGLAAFPLAGLELKALSFLLIAGSLFFLVRGAKASQVASESSDSEAEVCRDGQCPEQRDHRLSLVSGLPLVITLASILLVAGLLNWEALKTDPAYIIFAKGDLSNLANSSTAGIQIADSPKGQEDFFNSILEKVLPSQGYQSKIKLGDAVVKLVEAGVIDKSKFQALYSVRGGLPPELENALNRPSFEPIFLTRENANYYINLLWPLGLANFMDSNKNSPVAGPSLFNFASTGGWQLGKAQNGGEYFNKFKIVNLTPEQEALVVKLAQNSYRPCCNNSTFFQDCNHGSALLGLLELGASQGLSEKELWQEALAFNSFWFPSTYLQTAIYFEVVKGVPWEKVDPAVALGKDYSSASGWYRVSSEVQARGLMPQVQGGGGCGV